jgi:hypothetical protein
MLKSADHIRSRSLNLHASLNQPRTAKHARRGIISLFTQHCRTSILPSSLLTHLSAYPAQVLWTAYARLEIPGAVINSNPNATIHPPNVIIESHWNKKEGNWWQQDLEWIPEKGLGD